MVRKFDVDIRAYVIYVYMYVRDVLVYVFDVRVCIPLDLQLSIWSLTYIHHSSPLSR